MINLSGKDLSGLARGKAMFKGVSNGAAPADSEDQGFLSLVGFKNTEIKKNDTLKDLDDAALRMYGKKYSALAPDLQDIVTSEVSNSKKNAICEKCGNDHPADKGCYPHDVYANKKDGLTQGSKRYGSQPL